MPLSARCALPLLVIAQSACLVPNWLYEDDATESAATSALTATADPSTTGATADETETTLATATSAGSSDTTAAETAATTDATDTTGPDTTTGEPASCWSRAPDSWDSITQILDLDLGSKPAAARISPDGLGLVYIADYLGSRRPFIASRAARDQPFIAGQLLSDLAGIDDAGVDYPVYRVDPDGKRELIVAVGIPADLHITSDPNFGSLAPPLTSLNTAEDDTYATATPTGSRLIFTRRDGPFNSHLNGATFQTYEARRPADAPAGAGFSSPAQVPLTFADPPDPNFPDYPHYTACVALSPDGLRLFFGSSYPVILDSPAKKADALDIFTTERSSIELADWSPAIELHLFHEVGWETCPNAITADGCELVFHRFVLDPAQFPGQDTYKLYLARRAP
ncbi:MAG: hypothetical protein IPK80_29930 [Nannocystis sp.]|nr:hypothetical protein [Nannocystis sp.]